MTTEINTGGLKKFVYSKDHSPKLTEEEERGIDEAWEKVRIRKRKEKITRWTIISIIILLAGIYLLLK